MLDSRPERQNAKLENDRNTKKKHSGNEQLSNYKLHSGNT